jgi:hypothetical protein
VVEVAEEELAIHVEYFDAQLRLLHLERSQRAGSLEISTFREYADSFEFEEELLVENDQCPGLQNGLQDYATKRRSSETEGHEMQQISKRSCSSSSEEVEVEECLLEEPYSEGIDSEGLGSTPRGSTPRGSTPSIHLIEMRKPLFHASTVETRSFRF